MCRYRTLLLFCAWLLVLLSACDGEGSDPSVALLLVSEGISEPTSIAFSSDGGRMFVAERGGLVRVIQSGRLIDEPALDLTHLVASEHFIEQGLLGLALNPQFSANGYLYVLYTRRGGAFGGEGDVTVSRYQMSTERPNVADPASERIILVVDHYGYTGHNGGQLAFGPDGYLYVGIGDADAEGAPARNAQNIERPVGAILRLQLDEEHGYVVPDTNPFHENGGASEIWAIGLRNPWRFSFDRGTGDLWIGDVGETRAEEINYQPASSSGGENYGWPDVEGDTCVAPGGGCDGAFTSPVLTYDHAEGNCAVVGGYRYRGGIASLEGTYVYGDWCSGVIWGARSSSGVGWAAKPLIRAPFQVSTFGEDPTGELYVASFDGGEIYRIVGSR